MQGREKKLPLFELSRVLVRLDHVARYIVNPDDAAATIIEIRPFRNGWKCFEAPGVEPVLESRAGNRLRKEPHVLPCW